MAAGLGFKTFTTGEVLTAADTNGYLMQGINVFASTAARDAAITSPQEGQFAFTKDTNGLWYYDGAAWVASGATGDIEGVTAGIGISGGGTSGTVTVTNSMATAIDAKGDLVAGTAADTFSRLAVGANDTVLTADSTAATGLKWAAAAAGGTAYAAGKNGVLNSDFSVWQRGTSVAFGSYTYTADRWQAYNLPSVGTASRQVTGDTTNLPNIQYCARIQRTNGNSSTNAIQFSQSFETINSIQYAGKTVTLSFYARKGANYSPTSDILNYTLYTGTGTDQRVLAGYTGSANPINQNATLTTTWQRFSYSGTIAATATEIGLAFNFNPTGTAGANDYYEITGVQLEIASSASAFMTNCPTYATELAACQRYYFRQSGSSSEVYAAGSASSSTMHDANVMLKTTMRTTPTVLEYNNLSNTDGVTATAITTVTIIAGESTPNAVRIDAASASGLTQFRPYYVYGNGSSSYIGLSAEL
jgi:hypothetical protein